MHFFSVVSACLLCSSLAAAGPLPRDRPRKNQFRQVAPFQNTTSTTDSVAATIQVVPISLTETSLSTATATATTSPSTELSTASTASTLSTSGLVNTTSPSASTAATTAGDVPGITVSFPTKSAAGDGANAAQSAIGASQTAKTSISSNLSGFAPSGSIVQGTGNFSRATLGSTNSNTDASSDSKPTTGTQLFPFTESLTTTLGATSTTTEAPFTFSSDPVTPTTLSTRTTNAPFAVTVSGVGVAVPVTPSFFSSASPLPTTTEAPTATVEDPIIEVPTVITAAHTSSIPAASLAAVVAKNHDLANYYNDLFPTLKPDIRCAPNSIACIDGSKATCEDGRYVLEKCTVKSTACYAMPLPQSEGVYVGCIDIATAERILGLPNSLSVTIGSVPVVVPSTTAEVVQATSVTDPGPTTTTTAGEAAVTAAAVQSSDSNEGQEGADEETTVLHRTIVSTITIAVSDFAPSTVVVAANAATTVAADGSLISVVPVAAAVAGGSGNEEQGGPVTVTVTRSVTVTEQFTVTRAGVTTTVTAGGYSYI